jgi:hypothetical protein
METHQHTPRIIHVALWIAQSLAAGIFFLTGAMKTLMPVEQIAERLPWVATAPEALVRFIGISELMGAAGLIFPAALRIKPWLTPLSAALLALVMVLAAAFHLVSGEMGHAVAPAVLFLMSVFIAWGRSRKAPLKEIEPVFVRA